MKAAGKRFVAHPSRSDVFTLWNLSDLHLGNRACALKQFKRDVKRIRDDPHAFWISTGDNAEFIPFSDKRFDPMIVDPSITVSDLGDLGAILRDRLIELFDPIRNKCFGLGMGNHEKRYMLSKHRSKMHEEMCQTLQVPDLAYSSFFDLVFLRDPSEQSAHYIGTERYGRGLTAARFRVFTHHGAGWAVTRGGKLNRLIRFMQDFDADIFLVGHMHDQKGQRMPKLGASDMCNEIKSHDLIGVVSGSYLKTYDQDTTTYGEIRGYSPTTLGAAVVTICPETGEVKGEI